MAYSHKSLSKYQISNVEGTVGTAEAATEILYFEDLSYILHDKVFYQPLQDRGVLAKNVEKPFEVSELVELEATGTLYDRLAIFMMSNAIRGNVTPSQPDSMNEPNHYLWLFEPALTAPNTPDQTNGIDTFTLEWGDNVQAYETSYLFTVSLEISGAFNEDVKFTWNIQGRQVTESTITAGLTAVAAKYFATNNAKFYIDTSYAGLGGTQKSGVLKGFTWTLETMFSARFTSDGNLYFSALNEDAKEATLELTLVRDSSILEAELDAFQAQDLRFIRIELLSDGEMDSGQSNPEYIYLDGAYRYTEFPELDTEDGTRTISVSAKTFYDATSSKQFGVSVGTTMDAFAS